MWEWIIGLLIVGGGVSSVKIIQQGNEALVERLGVYDRKLVPGPKFVIPIIERVAFQETIREKVLDIPPQPCITRDNVSITVDAVVYWRIV
ncbi:MAG: SPFH domain-containing protein, partial [Leptodesmis sp.]